MNSNSAANFVPEAFGTYRHYRVPKKALKSATKVADFWKPYITEASYGELLKHLVSNLHEIHCATIGSIPGQEYEIPWYIERIPGVELAVPQNRLPQYVVTTIKSSGRIFSSYGFGQVPREGLPSIP